MSKSQTHVVNSRSSNKPTWKCAKNQSQEMKVQLNSEIITNLETDLAEVACENVKLKNENAVLKVELQELRDKINVLDKQNATNSESILKLQKDLKETAFRLYDKDDLYFEMEKKYMVQINFLTDTCKKEQEIAVAKENDLRNEISNLKARLEKSEEKLKMSIDQLNINRTKRCAYKEKLKFCVDLITKLNNFFNETLRTKLSTNQYCQTDVKINCSKSPACVYSGYSLESERMVLSELFFKENPFTDSVEEIFFIRGHK